MRIISNIKEDQNWTRNFSKDCLPNVTRISDISGYDILQLTINNGYIEPKICFKVSVQYDKKNTGDVMILNLPFYDNYGHCLQDVIPKLLWYDENHSADVIYTNHSDLLVSFIDLFDIRLKKIKFIKKEAYLNARNIIIENHPGWHHRDIFKIEKFKKIIDTKCVLYNQSEIHNRLIYCSRNHSSLVRHGRVMNSRNEDDIIAMLKKYCQDNNMLFTKFTGMDSNDQLLSLKEQLILFNQAKVVVGPHGSAMNNIIYLNPGNNPKVCEFTSGTQVQIHGGIFTKTYLELYGYLTDRIYDYYLIPFDKQSTNQITSININHLNTFLKTINISNI